MIMMARTPIRNTSTTRNAKNINMRSARNTRSITKTAWKRCMNTLRNTKKINTKKIMMVAG